MTAIFPSRWSQWTAICCQEQVVTLFSESNDELGDISVVTDRSGKVYLELPEPGVYSLLIHLDGFVGVRLGPVEVDAFVQPRQTIHRDLQVVMNPTLEIG